MAKKKKKKKEIKIENRLSCFMVSSKRESHLQAHLRSIAAVLRTSVFSQAFVALSGIRN